MKIAARIWYRWILITQSGYCFETLSIFCKSNVRKQLYKRVFYKCWIEISGRLLELEKEVFSRSKQAVLWRHQIVSRRFWSTHAQSFSNHLDGIIPLAKRVKRRKDRGLVFSTFWLVTPIIFQEIFYENTFLLPKPWVSIFAEKLT